MKTLVVGGTGLLGHEICRRLAEAARGVRALVRPASDRARRAELERLGVELVEGDLKDPASLARACAGAHAVISTASSTFSRQAGDSIETVDRRGQLALVNAAREAGVEHFVFVSFRENPDIHYPLTAAKRAVEHALKSSGMAYTILQASYFMEVWLTPALGFDAASGKVRMYGDGSRPISWVSYRDVARAAAAAVSEPAARNMVVEIGGPQALSQREVVRMFEAAGAGEITTESVAESALESQLNAATDPLEKSFAGLMLQCARGDEIDVTTSSRLFPFQMTSVRDYIHSAHAGLSPTGRLGSKASAPGSAHMRSVLADDSVTIRYKTIGEGPRDVLFVHCWGNSSVACDSLLEGFDTRGLRLIVPDLRGSGESDRPARGYTLERYATDMFAVADHAGSKQFVVVGHSMGGQIAMWMSSEAENRILGEILLMPVPPSGSVLDEATGELLRNSSGNRRSRTMIYNFGSPHMKPEVRERMLDDAITVAKPAIQEGFDAWSKASFVQRASKIRVPTLVVVSDDPFYSVQAQWEQTASVIPHARMAYIPDCGHWGPVERPREIAAVIQAFIAGARAGVFMEV